MKDKWLPGNHMFIIMYFGSEKYKPANGLVK